MEQQEILNWCEQNISAEGIIDFPEELFTSLTTETAMEISQRYGARSLMLLPQRERSFFEWLKQQDDEAWFDLWGADTEEQPYIVSLAFLPLLLDPSRGFPICDLINVDNYFFAPILMQTQEAKDLVEAVRDRFIAKHPLTVEQLLALEASLAPIDIWHFAWHHGVELARAKKAVERLVEDNILLHLKKAEDLANFIE